MTDATLRAVAQAALYRAATICQASAERADEPAEVAEATRNHDAIRDMADDPAWLRMIIDGALHCLAATSPAASPDAIVRAALKAVLSLAIDDATIVAAHVRALAADPAAVRAIAESVKP